jgi:carbonic anhydrase
MSSDFIKNIRQQLWVESQLAIDKEFSKIWLRTATPLLWIGCSDSRSCK